MYTVGQTVQYAFDSDYFRNQTKIKPPRGKVIEIVKHPDNGQTMYVVEHNAKRPNSFTESYFESEIEPVK